MKSNPQTDEWLATMRSAWKAGIDRDEREQSAASARRLARAVVPETERPRRQMFRDLLPLAACIAACALGGMWLRHTLTAPRASAVHDIRADEAIAPAEPAPIESPSAAATEASSAAPAASIGPARPPAAKVKSGPEALPPLPPPTPSNNGADESAHSRRMRRFELKVDGRWLRRPPPAPPAPPHPRGRLPHRPAQGPVRDL